MADQHLDSDDGGKQAHTPGPWAIEMTGPNSDEIMIVSTTAKDLDGDRIPVADLFRGGYDYSDFGFSLGANARLIAAAPDLRDVVKALLRGYIAASVDFMHVDSGREVAVLKREMEGDCLVAAARAALRKAGGNAND